MKRPDTTTTDGDEQHSDCQDAAFNGILNRLLVPLARLCLAHGTTFATVEDVLKRAFVQETIALQPNAPMHGTVSRVSAATGINRREVTRLVKMEAPEKRTKPPVAAEIFARWTTYPVWRDKDGAPLVLKRQGTAKSFETLARSITRDMHPRSMLDELIRLGLANYDEDLDQVSLVRADFVPQGDLQEMIGFLGDNVGDHLEASVDNVLHDGNRHLEQAVFADELSTESLEALRPLIMSQWQALRDALVPAITSLIEADRRAGRVQNQRVRFGLYSFAESTAADKPLPGTASAFSGRKTGKKGTTE